MFKSLLTEADTKKVSLITSSGGVFDLDLVTIESHESTLRITENPVESGANVADHAILEPKEITVNGVIVGYDKPRFKTANVSGVDISDYPLPIEVKAVTAQAEAIVNKTLGSFAIAAEETTRVIADWLPDYSPVITGNASTDRLNELYEVLLSLQKNGEFLTVSTHLKDYHNMLLVSISADQDKWLSAEVSLVFREVFVVETQKASGLHVKMPRFPKKRQLGKTKPKEVNNSVIFARVQQ